MGLGEYYRYLPLLFTYRTINTTKPLGGKLAPEERTFLKSNDEVNLDKIGFLLQRLPTDLVFIFKAVHIVGTHNSRAGGTTRARLFTFADYSLRGKCQREPYLYYLYLKIVFYLKVFLFENCFWLFDRFYGFKKVKFDGEVLID